MLRVKDNPDYEIYKKIVNQNVIHSNMRTFNRVTENRHFSGLSDQQNVRVRLLDTAIVDGKT